MDQGPFRRKRKLLGYTYTTLRPTDPLAITPIWDLWSARARTIGTRLDIKYCVLWQVPVIAAILQTPLRFPAWALRFPSKGKNVYANQCGSFSCLVWFFCASFWSLPAFGRTSSWRSFIITNPTLCSIHYLENNWKKQACTVGVPLFPMTKRRKQTKKK